MNARPQGTQWARLFTNRTFTALFIGQLVSSTGDLVYELALMWFVYGATGSAVKTGGVMITGMLAQILFGLPAGALVDRWNRKRIMISSDVFRGVIVLVAALLAGSGHLPLGYVYAASFCLRMTGLLFAPARNAVMPDIVGADLMMSANVASNLAGQLLGFLGLALGGVIIGFLGPARAMYVDAASFFFSATLITLVAIPDTRGLRTTERFSAQALRRDIGEGVSFLRQQQWLQVVMAIVLLVNFGSLLYAALTPMLVKTVLQTGPASYGLIEAAVVIGSLAGGLLITTVINRLSPHLAITIGLTGAGMTAILVGQAHSLPVALGLFGVMGCALVFNQTPLFTMLQTQTPGYVRGRVLNAFGVLANITGPLAVTIGTLLADRFHAPAVYGLGGGLVLVGALLALTRPDMLKPPVRAEVQHEAEHLSVHTGD